MRAAASWVLAVAVFTAGCSKPTAIEAEAVDDIPALNTKIEIDKAEIPARYSAALPANPADMKRWVEGDAQFPPIDHVRDQVLNGDERWIARLGEAANKVPAAAQAEWLTAWTNYSQYEVAIGSYCAPVRKIVAGPASAQRVALVGRYAATCASDAELDLIMRADTPDAAVIEYYSDSESQFASSAPKHPYHPRFASATRELILAGGYEARRAAFNLADHPDPRARAALRKIHAELKDRKLADEVALAFYESKDPADKALTSAACERRPNDPICSHPIFTSDVQQAEPPPGPAEIDAAKALIAKLAAVGFSKVSAVVPAEAAGADAGAVLALAGHAWWFDVETGMFPNDHDSLMRRLAALVSPALDAAVFEEVAPHIDAETAPYRLTVYIAGKRLRAEARNLGDWYDVEAVMNLLNAAAKESGSDVRFIPLPTGDQTLIILGAPGALIDRATRAGLIQTGIASDAERVGKEAEAEVLKSIQDR